MPELADILRLHGPEYIVKYQNRLLPSHRRAIGDICACRTEALGGHLYRCPNCRQEHYRYHSCKNRHCPKCQNDQANGWLAKQRSLLLPVSYFMATFTLPHGLRHLARGRQRTVYDMLFQASRQTLQKLAHDPKYIGGKPGMIGVLHTWTRNLRYHPHIHYLIPGGGLAGQTWRPARAGYLLPEKPLAQIFRAKFRDLLQKERLIEQIPSKIWRQDWVVDIIPVGNGQAAFKYLSPYIFRTAISNRNILALKNGQVTFRYRDAKTKTHQITTLPAEQFIGRFLQHSLPRGFQKVRTYGLLHPKQRRLLAIVKEQLQPQPCATANPPHQTPIANHTSNSLPTPLCPKCAFQMIHIAEIPRKRGPP